PHLAHALESTSYAAVRRLFQVGGRLAGDGDRVKRPDLAKTLKAWAKSAGEDLHAGPGARSLVAAARGEGGTLAEADLVAYTPVSRAPLVGRYGDLTLVTMGPPSSGGVVLLQALAVLEGYDLESLGHNSSAYVHLVTEVLQHAYADRAHHLGDPDHVEVPVDRLLAPERIEAIRRAIWPARTFPPDHYGPLIAPPRDAGTQHISAVDRDGMSVALTTTINTSFGSDVVDPRTSIVLNNEMDDFAAAPGTPNAYGLVGDEQNAIAPGKRPLSSMTPTVVLDADGKVLMSIGASGGSTIISAVLQVLLDVVVFDMDPQEAVAAPRFHHQWQPSTLWLEPGFPLDVQRALESIGHTVTVRPGFSSVQLVVRAGEGRYEGGADPRKGRWPAREASR
ncbi:MAG: gamma-glutamyltransferase, partial [Myxococcales bacterium]|nr:gamma-glutamyltransferase [Myxococcales bacterium]